MEFRAPDSADSDGASTERLEPQSAEQLREWIASHRGSPMLVNYWATWCDPCVAEMPDFLAVAEEFASDGLVCLIVAMDPMVYGYPKDRMATDVPKFLVERGWDLPCRLFDGEAKPARIVEVLGVAGALPTTVLIDRDGERVEVHRGRATREEFRAFAEQVLEIR